MCLACDDAPMGGRAENRGASAGGADAAVGTGDTGEASMLDDTIAIVFDEPFVPAEQADCFAGEVERCSCDDGGTGTRRCGPEGGVVSACECAAHLEEGFALPEDVRCALERHCLACHGEPQLADAPMPLLDWQDLHAPTPSQPEIPLYMWLGDRVGRDDALRMPPPPRRAVSSRMKAELLAWVRAGAPPSDVAIGMRDGGIDGGTASTAECSPVDPPIVTDGGLDGGLDGGGDGGDDAAVDPCADAPRTCSCSDSAYIGQMLCAADGALTCVCPEPADCYGGEARTCDCSNGMLGVQQCLLTGDAVGPCDCTFRFQTPLLPPHISCALQRNCTVCHGVIPLFDAPMPLTDWNALHAATPSAPQDPVYATLLTRLGREDDMRMPPPSRPEIHPAERKWLLEWAQQGARPQAGPVLTDGPDPNMQIPAEVWDVLENHCHACHGSYEMDGAPPLLRADQFWERSSSGSPIWQAAFLILRQRPPPHDFPMPGADRAVLEHWIGAPPSDCTPL